MIIANIKQLQPYKKISENLKIAIEYLETVDMNSLELGIYDIKGEDIYAMVSSYTNFDPKERQHEAHNNYIDIQYVIDGEEYAYCCDRSKLKPSSEYIVDRDKQDFAGDAEEVAIRLQKGLVAIYFPSDAHKVCCKIDEPKQVRKLVIKVKV